MGTRGFTTQELIDEYRGWLTERGHRFTFVRQHATEEFCRKPVCSPSVKLQPGLTMTRFSECLQEVQFPLCENSKPLTLWNEFTSGPERYCF